MHDAYSGLGQRRGPAEPRGMASGAPVAGTGAGFTGVSPRIEVVGLHYEVTPQDLKVRSCPAHIRPMSDQTEHLFPGGHSGPGTYYPRKL